MADTLDELKIVIDADTSQLEQGLKSAEKSVKSFGDKVNSQAGKIDILGGKQATQSIKSLGQSIKAFSNGNASSGASSLVDMFGGMASSAKAAGVSVKALVAGFAKISLIVAAVVVSIKIIKSITQSATEGMKKLAVYDKEMLKGAKGYNQALSEIKTSFAKLKLQMQATFGTMLADLVKTLEPIITKVTNLLTKFIETIGMFYAMLTGSPTYTVANPEYWVDYADATKSAVKQQKLLINGFDELNRLDSKDNGSLNDLSKWDKNQWIEKETPTFKDWWENFKTNFKDKWENFVGEINDKFNLDINPDEALIAVGAVAAAIGALALLKGIGSPLGIVIATSSALAGIALVHNACKKFMEEKYEAEVSVRYDSKAPTLDYISMKLREIGGTVAKPVVRLLVYGLSDAIQDVSDAITLIDKIIHEGWDGAMEWIKKGNTISSNNILEWSINTQNTFKLWKSRVERVTSSLNLNEGVTNAIAAVLTTIDRFYDSSFGKFYALITNTEGLFVAWKLFEKVEPVLRKVLTAINTFVEKAKGKLKELINDISDAYNAAKSPGYQTQSQTIASTNKKGTTKEVKSSSLNGLKSYNTGKNLINAMNNMDDSTTKRFLQTSGLVLGAAVTGGALGTLASQIAGAYGISASAIVAGIKANIPQIAGGSAILTSSLYQKLLNYLKSLNVNQGYVSYGGKFANGGVITKPTIGLVGEYAGARSNPEIITPENKMRDIFESSNNAVVNAFIQCTRQIIQSIENKDMSVSIGDKDIAYACARGNKDYIRMTGKALI